jgi:hypothetical protein
MSENSRHEGFEDRPGGQALAGMALIPGIWLTLTGHACISMQPGLHTGTSYAA